MKGGHLLEASPRPISHPLAIFCGTSCHKLPQTATVSDLKVGSKHNVLRDLRRYKQCVPLVPRFSNFFFSWSDSECELVICGRICRSSQNRIFKDRSRTHNRLRSCNSVSYAEHHVNRIILGKNLGPSVWSVRKRCWFKCNGLPSRLRRNSQL